MKNILLPLLVLVMALGAVSKSTAQNPYLPLWEHLPDGEPRVFEDPDWPGHYRVYIIGSHDVRYRDYCGPDIRAWSAPVEDLSDWRDEGPIFTYPIEGQWDVMFAPDLVEVQMRGETEKEYRLYPHSRGVNREPMVARGDRPDGPFVPVNMTPDGKATLPGGIMGFDPSVYIEPVDDPRDPDYGVGFRAYGFWGFQRSQAAQLDQNTMWSVRPGTEVIPYFMPASAHYGEVRDPKGTEYPYLFVGEDPADYNFFEASSIRRVGNKYLLIYSGYSGPEYGLESSNSTLRYAFGDTPLGPWKIGGVLVDSRAPVPNENGTALQTTNAGHNTHGSLQEINGMWWVFYHRPPRGFGFARQAMVAPVAIDWDEEPVGQGGRVRVRGYDPYAPDGQWSARDGRGMEYTGAEVTSEGFQIYGLDPYRYYSAGYACYLSDISTQQDSWDIWDNDMPVAGVSNGDIVGYKYFGFGGLAQDTCGIKAFEGTRPGNGTELNLWLTPRTDRSFKVNVWLDGPWDNETWRGKKIGEIVVPAGCASEITRFAVDVSTFVDRLDGKHAIYLVTEGPADGSLFDLSGLGFARGGDVLVRPTPPAIEIRVNGKPVEIPTIPVRSTNENGIVGYGLYEIDPGALPKAGETIVVTASASDPEVKISIAQSPAGSATVAFDHKGTVKTYVIKFDEN